MQPKFKLFEEVCEELSDAGGAVLTEKDLGDTLISALKKEMKVGESATAILKAVGMLSSHFEAKGGRLPFSFDPATGEFKVIDLDYIQFVAKMVNGRGVRAESKTFELDCTDWIARRLHGDVHRIGWPRTNGTKTAFVSYMKKFGFDDRVINGNEKDGGFDIVWFPPLGNLPYRLVVSIQCKNGNYNLKAGDASIGSVNRSLDKHDGLQTIVHVPCVLYNDYITTEILPEKRMAWLPLGLSDFVQNRTAPIVAKL